MENQTVEGPIQMLRSATTKTGKPYYQLQVLDIFMFWWSQNKPKEFKEDDVVKVTYKPGNFVTVLTVEKIESSFQEEVAPSNEITTFLDEMGDNDFGYEVTEERFGIKKADVILGNLISTGEIFEMRPGKFRVLK